MHIIELTDPDTPAIRYTHEFNSAGDGEITDVQVCSDTIAVSIASNNKVSIGHVELFLPFTKNDNTLTMLGRLAGRFDLKNLSKLYHYKLQQSRP